MGSRRRSDESGSRSDPLDPAYDLPAPSYDELKDKFDDLVDQLNEALEENTRELFSEHSQMAMLNALWQIKGRYALSHTYIAKTFGASVSEIRAALTAGVWTKPANGLEPIDLYRVVTKFRVVYSRVIPAQWLDSANARFGGLSPLEMMKLGRTEEVMDLLIAEQDGSYL